MSILFFVLWLSLGAILVSHAIIRRRWITGQTAFTGVWFASLTGLWVYTPAQEFISEWAALLIIFVHLSFFVGSVFTSIILRGRWSTVSDRTTVARVWSYAFCLLALVGLVGSCLAVSKTGAIHAVRENQLANMRSMMGLQYLELGVFVRFMSNMLYPAAVVGGVCFLHSGRSRFSWIFILLPVLGLILYGFAFGGRGAILPGFAMLAWVLIIFNELPHVVIKRRSVRFLLFMSFILVFAFSAAIVTTRQDVGNPFESIYTYFVGPIPALSEWGSWQTFSLIRFDVSDVSIFREVLRAMGIYGVSERSVGFEVVYVPFRFNVFTHLADQLLAFGIIGTLICTGILGVLSSRLENAPQSRTILGLRGTLYGYLTFSLLTDLAFFIVGWWLTFIIVGLVLPALSGAFMRAPYPAAVKVSALSRAPATAKD